MNDDPYHDGGTRGHGDTDTSREAARADLLHGVTNELQQRVLRYARAAQGAGITVAEVRSGSGQHHGRASSAVTKMHIAGKLVRLTERRSHAHVYVLPEWVEGREVLPYRRQRPKPRRVETLNELRALPLGTVLLDSGGDAWQRIADWGWGMAGDEIPEPPHSLFESCSPLVILHEPEVE